MKKTSSDAKGRKLVSVSSRPISPSRGYDPLVTLDFEDGSTLAFGHYQGCCEYVYLEDGEDDLEELVGSTIVSIEDVESDPPAGSGPDAYWTFYKIATTGGYATLRFCGESHYYSTAVDVEWFDSEGRKDGAMSTSAIQYRFKGDDRWFSIPGVCNFIDISTTLLQMLADPTIADIRFDEANVAPGDMRRLDWERFKELCLDFIEEGLKEN